MGELFDGDGDGVDGRSGPTSIIRDQADDVLTRSQLAGSSKNIKSNTGTLSFYVVPGRVASLITKANPVGTCTNSGNHNGLANSVGLKILTGL